MQQIQSRLKNLAVLSFALLSCALSTASWAQPSVAVLVRGTAHQALFSVDFDGSRGIAVGAFGEMQSTEDGGKTWKKSKLPTDLTLLDVHTDSARTLVVGQAGTIFVRDPGGEWAAVDSGVTSRLFGVASNPDGLAAAAGEFGTLLLSQDGGRSWHKLTLDWMQIGTDGGAEPHLYGVDVAADGKITVVGEFGLVLRSSDLGRSWGVLSRGTPSVFAVEIRDDGTGFAVGQDGYALKTADGGTTWTCLDIGSKAILNGVYSNAEGQVTVTAMREMLTSSDDGLTWTSVKDSEVTSLWYVGVGSGGGAPVAVGQAGSIIKIGG